MAVATTYTMTARGSATAPIRVVFASTPMRASVTSSLPRELPEAPRATLGRDDHFNYKHDATDQRLVRTSENLPSIAACSVIDPLPLRASNAGSRVPWRSPL